MSKEANILDSSISYNSIDDRDVIRMISAIRQGIKYNKFTSLANKSPFSLPEWSGFLHISDRTMQRYKKEKATFNALQSEKILQIMLLISLGTEVFGDENKFYVWLNHKNLVLGGIKPKDLLDNSFGIGLLKDELNRIEHGILA